MTPRAFRKIVLGHYMAHGRHSLPWRHTPNPYRIMVSEIMLQQTQVERVIPFYQKWLQAYPSVQALSAAPLGDVLRLWHGLGYPRRAKMLHDAAKEIVSKHTGRVPKDISSLEYLPGIGPYTARAIAAFAYNQDVLLIETNIRTALIYHFFSDATNVQDTELETILTQVLLKGSSREWYAALMDYGAHLKKSGIRINKKSATYTKQKSYTGSAREARGAILRSLLEQPKSRKHLRPVLGIEREKQIDEQLDALSAEGLITRAGTIYSLPS